MMLHTIMPGELIFAEESAVVGANLVLMRDGVWVEVTGSQTEDARISRLISTNPMDYLSPEFQPGTIHHG